jgi:hypothetical protein
MARLMLFVGARSGRIADLTAPLAAVADVVVATSQDLLAQRADDPGQLAGLEVVRAPTRAALLEQALGYARRHPVDGALCFSDDVVEVTACFAAAAGLPGQPVNTIRCFRDKLVQRLTLATREIPVPAFHGIGRLADTGPALQRVPLPAMLKPTRGSGGSFVRLVTDPDQLPGLVVDGLAGARSPLILESVLVGQASHSVDGLAPYVSVESVAAGGEIMHLAVTDRFPVAPPALETGMLLPSCLPGPARETVIATADAALRALDFSQGLAHTELMLTADGPRVIEVNARAGGALPYLFGLAGRHDLVRIAGRAALGEVPAEPPVFDRHAVFVAPQHPLDVEVCSVAGLDEVAAVPGVRAVIPMAGAGARTAGFQNTLAAVVLGVAGTAAEGVVLWREIMSRVRCAYRPLAAAGTELVPG